MERVEGHLHLPIFLVWGPRGKLGTVFHLAWSLKEAFFSLLHGPERSLIEWAGPGQAPPYLQHGCLQGQKVQSLANGPLPGLL